MSLIKTIITIFFFLLFLLIEQSFLFAEDKTTHDLENINKLFQASLEDLMHIEVVSATRIKQNITEAPSIMTVITAQQIRERGYQSVAEAVRTVPGFSLWVDNFMSSISVRGFNSIQGWNQNLKIMIDGQPVSYRPANWTPIDEELIPIRCVKKIEVIKGPASALYGANAYLGAINIITFDGNEFDSVEATGIGGSLDTYGGSFVVGKKIDEIDFMTAFSAQRLNRSGLSYLNPVPNDYANKESENDVSEPKSFYGKISYKELTMSANYQRLYKSAEFTNFTTLEYSNLLCINNWFIKGDYEKLLFNDKLNLKGSLAYGEGGTDNEEEKKNVPANKGYIKKDIGVRFVDLKVESFYKFAEKNSIGIGIDYTTDNQQLQNNYIINMTTGAKLPLSDEAPQPRKDFNNFGIYLQNVYYLNPNTGLTGGLRFDSHNLYGDSTTYRIGITNRISDKLYLKILYGTSFKTPTPRQLFDPLCSDVTHDTIGNKNLVPQHARTFETLFGFKLSKTLHGELGGFYTIIKDGIELLPINDNSGNYTYYQRDLKSFGFEGGLDAQFSKNLKGRINFSYQKTKYDDTNKNTNFVPKITANAVLNYLFMEHLNVNLENIFVGKRISPKKFDENYTIPAYLLVNLTLSTKDIRIFNNKETIFSLNCSDIFNEKYIDPGPPKDGYDIPHHGRRFLITISQNF